MNKRIDLPVLSNKLAQVLAKQWKEYYNKVRPHSGLRGRPPAPQSILLTA
jgi:transposase InsO family protein